MKPVHRTLSSGSVGTIWSWLTTSRDIQNHATCNNSVGQVIKRCKAIFARFGHPEILIMDNGSQFSCHECAQFANYSDFPCDKWPQIATEKQKYFFKLVKDGDFHKALMVYRATALQPQQPNLKTFKKKNATLKTLLTPHTDSASSTTRTDGMGHANNNTRKVVEPVSTPCSYGVDTSGGQLCRNMSHLKVMPGSCVSFNMKVPQ